MHRDSCILDDDNKSPFECQDIAAVAVQQLQRNPFLIPSRPFPEPLPNPFPTPSLPLPNPFLSPSKANKTKRKMLQQMQSAMSAKGRKEQPAEGAAI